MPMASLAESGEQQRSEATCPLEAQNAKGCEIVMKPRKLFAALHPIKITACLILMALSISPAPCSAAQTRVPLQPFAQQVRQVETSLAYLGQPLTQQDQDAINQAIGN